MIHRCVSFDYYDLNSHISICPFTMVGGEEKRYLVAKVKKVHDAENKPV